MKYAEVTLSGCVLALAAFVGLQARELRGMPNRSAEVAPGAPGSIAVTIDAA